MSTIGSRLSHLGLSLSRTSLVADTRDKKVQSKRLNLERGVQDAHKILMLTRLVDKVWPTCGFSPQLQFYSLLEQDFCGISKNRNKSQRAMPCFHLQRSDKELIENLND
jgi:hypothetical protein